MAHTHSHSYRRGAETWLLVAMAITLALVAAEFVTGTLGHSLSLVSDGWHNLSDLPSLFFAWFAIHLEQRPPDHRKTFGYQRAGVLAAFINALILVVVSVLIGYAGYGRIRRPLSADSGMMIAVGVAALAVNGLITLGLVRGRRDLNVRAIFIHSLGDAASSLAIIAGALIIRTTGLRVVDPVVALLIAVLILWGAAGILGESVNILLESLPKGMAVSDVANAMLAVQGVQEVHDVHIWSLNAGSHALACHIRILDMPTSEGERIIRELQSALAKQFRITHCTIQMEHTHPPGEFHTYMPEPARIRQPDK